VTGTATVVDSDLDVLPATVIEEVAAQEGYEIVALESGEKPGEWLLTVKTRRPRPDDDFRFEWSFSDDTAGHKGTEQTHTFSEPGSYVVTVTALDRRGAVAFVLSLHLDVLVVNEPPVANAGDDQTVDENTLVFLYGGESIDPDSPELTYLWTQVSGLPVVALLNVTEPTARFVAPYVDTDTELAFSLTVSDGESTDQNRVTIYVLDYVDPASFGPTADAGPDQEVEAGAVVTLDGTASTGSGESPLAFFWTQVEGLSVTLDAQNAATVTFTAPNVEGETVVLVFELSVAQDDLFALDDVRVTVLRTDPPPPPPPPPPPDCASDAECDDGAFCNGAETCVSGSCVVGSDPCAGQLCDETVDACVECISDSDCDDEMFCNGLETCVNNTCQPGPAVNCDDGLACTVDSCNEATDSCDNAPDDSLCDNGLFCDGAEVCNPMLGCQAGTPADCDDGVACTVDSCNEATDACVYAPNDSLCDNGLFCDGVEVCNPVLGCQAGTPVDCDDGVACTVDSCNEATDSCDNAPNDALCDNGLFCDGVEVCNPVLGCQAGAPVDCDDGVACTVDSCDEATDSCDNAPGDALCDNGLFCDGAEVCNPVLGCQAGTPFDCNDGVACTVDSCNEAIDSCDNAPDDSSCDNGLFCDGTEACDPVLGCQGGDDPCPAQTCDEDTDTCEEIICDEDVDCDDNVFCNGAETCVSNTCQPGIPVNCDDGTACTVDSCNEATDACDHAPNDSLCDNGLFCDGSETCDPLLGCQVGTPVDCDDGVACTTDSCNEATDSCDNVSDDSLCDNGLFCDGPETCDPKLDCQPGAPVDCDDGVACTANSCNEATDSCDNAPDDALCDNGLFCDGVETCDPVFGCQAGNPVNCGDGVPCTIDSCNEATDSCDNVPSDANCDNGLFCDGVETCDPVLDCQAGTDPCGGDPCDEENDECVPATPSVSLSNLDFGSTLLSLQFEVWNSGGDLLDYTIVDDADWLTVSPNSGDSTGEHDTITATVDRTDLTDGSYQAEITVTPSVVPAITIAVFLVVQPQCDSLTPIARWDVVPYQRINAGETFKAGVVAFSKNGIQKVTFTISGQGYTDPASIDVTQMTYNDRTDVHEYWIPIAAGSFTSDGPITVEAIVHGNDGGIRDKNTGGGSLGLDALPLIVNPTGSLPQPEAWVDNGGNDSTGEVNNPAQPYLTIRAAINAIRAWRSPLGYGDNAAGGVVRLYAGVHSAVSSAPSVLGGDEWVTVTTAAGGNTSNTIVIAASAIRNVERVAIKGITLDRSGGGGAIVAANSTVGSLMQVWIDDCALIGSGRWILQSNPVGLNPRTVYWTDSSITACDYATRNTAEQYLARGLTISTIGHDAFQNFPMIVNCTVDDIDNGDNSSWHADAMQWWGGHRDSNVIVYNYRATNCHYQGLFIRGRRTSDPEPPNAQGMAFVNVYIDMADDASGSSGWYRRVDHLIWWHCTFRSNLGFFVDPLDGYSSWPVEITDFSAKGNVFNEMRLNQPDSGIEWDDWHENHFEVQSGGSVITRGTSQTTGDPGVDADGYPVSGSVLLGKVTQELVPADSAGVLREMPASAGAYE